MCFIIIDLECQQAVLLANGIETIAKLLRHSESNIVLNAIGALMQLLDVPEAKQKIISSNILDDIKALENSENVCIKKISIAFCEEVKTSLPEKH